MHATNPASPVSPVTGLRGKIIRGGAWVSAQYGFRQLLAFLRVIIVARNVAPTDLGVLGMAALAVTLVRVVSETGVQQAVVQRRDASNNVLDTAWTILLIRNLAMALLLALGAGIVASFFHDSRVEPVLRIVSLVLVLDGLTNIAVALFQRRLDFRRQALYLGGGDLIEFIVTVSLAMALKNVWALVYGWIAGAAARVILSYVVEPRRPRLLFERATAASLLGYGKWLTVSSMLVYVLTQGDKVIVGRFMGATSLGFYNLAFKVSNLPATAVTHVISSVMFPVYAKVQDDRARLARLYLRSLRLSVLCSVPAAVLIAALADGLVNVFLGARWEPSIPLIQLLAAYGLLRSFGATTGSVFLAIGRPRIRTMIQVTQVLIFAAAVYPMTVSWGLAGIAASVTTYALATNLYAVRRAAKECSVAARDVVEAVLVPLTAGAIAFAAISILRLLDAMDQPSLWSLISLGATGALAYAGSIIVYDIVAKRSWRADVIEAATAGRHPR
jgi:lipopolysaccharide exporter